MKKIRIFLKSAVVAMIFGAALTNTNSVNAQLVDSSEKNFHSRQQSKKQAKRSAKSAKNSAKEMRKKGWEVVGSTRTIEDAFIAHYEKLTRTEGEELSGMAINCAVPANCKTAAFNDAALNYARLTTGEIIERMNGDSNLDQAREDSAEEFNKFYQAFESYARASIKGIMGSTPSLSLQNKTTKEFWVFYIVDAKGAAKARQEAYELAMKEAEMIKALERATKQTEKAQEYARKISDFVNEKPNLPSIVDE
ncbi:MAG: hypothetical protein FWH18_08060 [Marinilabiliaceae bacterium]|nr:hypothetical protein [Marinilabiliaceae bacterium]